MRSVFLRTFCTISGLLASAGVASAGPGDVETRFVTVAEEGPFTASKANPLAESLGDGIVRYFADASAREGAFPSYALLKDGPGGPAPAKLGVAPTFGVVGGKVAAIVKIEPGTSLYGTGEVAGPLLRNGRRTTTWNTDSYGYGDDAKSLYQAHPWVLAVRADGSAFGVLADSTYRVLVDTAATKRDEIRFVADGPAFPVIVIEGATPQDVLKGLGALTGTMPMPPKWAIGYHQCRYSYYPESRAREIAKGFRDRKIPADVIWYDIDYMAGFRVFTFNREFFPDPKKLNTDLMAMGFHNVWMIDPGIKSRSDASSNDPRPEDIEKWSPELKSAMEKEWSYFKSFVASGTKADVWVKDKSGKHYEGEVWPSWCFFPDYTDPGVRTWWAGWYKDFSAQGVTGVWNDMNEPAVFNVPSKTMPEENLHRGDPTMVGPTGSAQGARAAGNHARYHNVYGMMMIKGTREGMLAANPDKRPFVLSRANYIGGQRYAPTWTGDNTADWYHVETSVSMVLNIGLSGQPFTGPDIGGFVGNGDGPMFARWMGFGSLFPFARGHTGKGNVDKEPWSFGPEVEKTCRVALERRYRLLPYLYTCFYDASTTGLPIARPLFFADPKDQALRTEDDGFLLGADVLVMAQMMPDGSRVPVMPKGVWCPIEVSNDPHLPRLYIRGGAIVPTGPTIQFVGEKPLDPVTLLVCLDEKGQASGQMYEDAGDGFGYQQGEYLLTTYTASMVAGAAGGGSGAVTVKVSGTEGKMPRAARNVVVKVVLPGGKEATGQGVDGAEIVVKLP
jgi:alpha-glucosidase